jgi:3-hydroxyacyl-CoA dehydrogenase
MVRKIRKAAVIGAGIMGGGIAALLASAGIPTVMLDLVPEDLLPEEKQNSKARSRLAQAGLDRIRKSEPPLLMHPTDIDQICTGNLEDDFLDMKECDWIVEAVVEDLQIKQSLFRRIASVRAPHAIVTTNTSGLPLNALCKDLDDEFKRHFLGTHFFNPVRYMRLVELIAGESTLPEICEFMERFCGRILGKGVVWAKDTPQFVANRIGVFHMIRAMQLMREEGLTIPEVDCLFGPILGRPKTAIFKTCDLVGIDTLVKVAEYAYQFLSRDPQRQGFRPPEFLGDMVKKRLLGQKSQSGFYKSMKTDAGATTRLVIDPETLQYRVALPAEFPCVKAAGAAGSLGERLNTVVYGEDRGARFSWKVIAEYLLYAADRIGEIADTIVDMDNAMRWGFNFEMGPFETWDALGLENSLEKMTFEGRSIPRHIREMVSDGCKSFYTVENGIRLYYDFRQKAYLPIAGDDSRLFLSDLKAAGKTVLRSPSASLVDLGDDIFCCEFHTKMNVINGEIVDFLDQCIEFVDSTGAGMVIGNQSQAFPGTFSAGGDLRMMSAMARSGRYSDLESVLKRAQEVMLKARYAYFPVVAAPYGMTLGGGCELCLGAADTIVAHRELYMGLVEVAVGLLPAAGGCLNFWKKLTRGIPEAVEDVDLSKYFFTAFKTIAMATVSSSARHARYLGFLDRGDRIVANSEHLVGEAKREALRMARDGYRPPVKQPVRVFGDAAHGIVASELNNLVQGGSVSPYDSFLAGRIAYVISGGDIRTGSEIDETVILKLERDAFIDLWKQAKTRDRVEHMLNTGRPLRN